MNDFNISTKSDIVSLIIFKRKLRQLLNNFTRFLIFASFISFLCICFYYRTIIFSTISQINTTIRNICDQLFAVKINNIRIQLDNKNSLLDDEEIKNIIQQIKSKKIDKAEMRQIIKKIVTTNSLVENVYIRKNLSKNELIISLKERKIIGIFYSDNCNNVIDEKCAKNIISSDNKFYPYHSLKNDNEILKIYGKINPTVNLQNIHKILKKYSLLHKIAYIKFYSSGRFDATFKNNLVVKFPRQNLVESIQRFNKLDADFFISSDTGLKYIDLRIGDKLFVTQNKQ